VRRLAALVALVALVVAGVVAGPGLIAGAGPDRTVAAASLPPGGGVASPQPSASPTASPSRAASPSPSPARPSPPARRPLRSVGDPRLQAMIARWAKAAGVPGLSAAVVYPDGRLWVGTVGVADAATDEPVTPDTAFALASITKTFTAAIVLQLVDEGILSLDDRAADLLPEGGFHAAMTLRDLLDHTSGLNDYFRETGIEPALNADLHRVWTPEEILAEFGMTHRVPPGTFWRYSNTGYLYLGLIAERATGTPWDRLVRDRLLDPLDLDHAFVQGSESPRGPLAEGHRGTPGAHRVLGGDDPLSPFTSVVTAAGPAGAIAGTAEDAARWAAALYGGQVLSRATLTAAIADVDRTAVHFPRVPYGLGVQVIPIGKQVTWGHSGTFTGFRGHVRWLPDRRIAVALLTNQSRVDPAPLMRTLLEYVAVIEPIPGCQTCD
jgi:D-alanyl-D-alanine carboxypeptidase